MRRNAATTVPALAVLVVLLGACLPAQDPSGAPGSVLAAIRDPTNGDARDFSWHRTPATTPGRNLTLAFLPARDAPGRDHSIMIVPGTGGPGRQHLELARRYADRGFDVGVACFYAPAPRAVQWGIGFPCYNAPSYTGQSDMAARDLSALVVAMHRLPGQRTRTIGLVGHSRGGGTVAVRASLGHREPIVIASGLLTYPIWLGHFPGEVMPFHRAGRIRAPQLVWHQAHDPLTTLDQAGWYAFAMELHGRPTTYRVDPGSAHDFPFLDEQEEFVDVTSAWLHARL